MRAIRSYIFSWFFVGVALAAGHGTANGQTLVGAAFTDQGELPLNAEPDTVPVKAFVRPVCGGVGALETIGDIVVTTEGNAIMAAFTFKPQFRYLDKWYDFRWINVIITFEPSVDTDGDGFNEVPVPFPPPIGVVNHDLPFVDPVPGQVGGENPTNDAVDPAPYYYDNVGEWDDGMFGRLDIRDECLQSTFQDARGALELTFKTFLVIDAVTAAGLPANTFWVLDGFKWSRMAAGGVAFGGALPPELAPINNGMNEGGPVGGAPEPNMNGPWIAWTAAPREDCPLEACPSQVDVLLLSQEIDPDNRNCCVFEWAVTNNGTLPVNEFYLDLEAGTGGERCRDIIVPGWTATYCYPWDFGVPSNWGVICFMAEDLDGDGNPDGLAPGDSLIGFTTIEVNQNADVQVKLRDWHPFEVPAKGIHVHVTDYSPECLGVNCAAGQFGPHIETDIHSRDQSCFWSGPSDWVCSPPCPADLDNSGDVGVKDLLFLLGAWGPCP